MQKDNKGEGEKMGVVSTKNQFSANIMKFLAIFFWKIGRFSANSCQNPIIFYHHLYFREIEVWSEFRDSPIKINGSCPSAVALPENGQHLG